MSAYQLTIMKRPAGESHLEDIRPIVKFSLFPIPIPSLRTEDVPRYQAEAEAE